MQWYSKMEATKELVGDSFFLAHVNPIILKSYVYWNSFRRVFVHEGEGVSFCCFMTITIVKPAFSPSC